MKYPFVLARQHLNVSFFPHSGGPWSSHLSPNLTWQRLGALHSPLVTSVSAWICSVAACGPAILQHHHY